MACWTMYNLRRFSTQIRSRSYVAYPVIPVGTGFVPTDLGADLWAWYDASYAPSVTIATGVSNLADRSGNARDATNGVGGTQPALASAVQNGLDALYYDATAAFVLDIPDMSALTAGTYVAIAKRDEDPPTGSGASGGDAGPVLYSGTSVENEHHPYNDGTIYDSFGSTVRKTAGNPTPSLASWFLFSARSAASDYEFYVNGTSLFSTGTNTVGFNTLPSIGLSRAAAQNYRFEGHIGEVVILGVAATTANRQKVEGYLAWKWGVESILPVGHPYELAPP
jgi:hypothetical protein